MDHGAIDKDDKAWELFEAKHGDRSKKTTIRLSDVPLPQASGCLDNEIFKRWALRWHPDKFIQRYGTKLAGNEKQEIEDAVKGVFQEISAAR